MKEKYMCSILGTGNSQKGGGSSIFQIEHCLLWAQCLQWASKITLDEKVGLHMGSCCLVQTWAWIDLKNTRRNLSLSMQFWSLVLAKETSFKNSEMNHIFSFQNIFSVNRSAFAIFVPTYLLCKWWEHCHHTAQSGSQSHKDHRHILAMSLLNCRWPGHSLSPCLEA